MTENEAIKVINDKYETFFALSTTNVFDIAMATAIKALEEIQQYRAIGTMKEVRMLKDYKELYDVYKLIGTIEEFKDLKEKNVAKKPRFYAHNYYCTECGNLVGNNEFEWQRFLYCDKCGQKLDWQ